MGFLKVVKTSNLQLSWANQMETPSSTTEGNSAGKLRRGLGSSRKKLASLFAGLTLGPKKIDEDFFKHLESALLSVDIGPNSVSVMLESLVENLARSSLSDPKILLPELKRIMVEKLSSFQSEMEIGSSAPHIVFFVNNIDKFNILKFGPEIENHDLFPEKINVSIANVVSKNEINLNVWEREQDTL